MPKVKQELSVDSLRHAEYYGMQQIYDDLYTKSKNGEPFSGLMDIILSRENILLAYRNIKAILFSQRVELFAEFFYLIIGKIIS